MKRERRRTRRERRVKKGSDGVRMGPKKKIASYIWKLEGNTELRSLTLARGHLSCAKGFGGMNSRLMGVGSLSNW